MSKDSKVEQLMEAIQNREVSVAKVLIADMTPKQLETIDLVDMTPLHRAVSCGEIELVKLIMDKASEGAVNSSGMQGTPLHILVKHYVNNEETIEIAKLLLSKMSQEAIKARDISGNTILYIAVVNNFNLKLCELILNANPNIVNIGNYNNKTTLDRIGEENYNVNPEIYRDAESLRKMSEYKEAEELMKQGQLNAEREKTAIAKLLCEHGGVFNQPEKVKGKFQAWIEPIKMIDRILSLEKPKTKLETPPELYKMLINRFQNNIIRKIEEKCSKQEFIELMAFVQTQEDQLPAEIYQKVSTFVYEATVAESELNECEAQLIQLLESTPDNPLASVPFNALKDMSGESLKILKFAENTKEFYEKNPDCTVPGGYLKKLSQLPKKELGAKLDFNMEDMLEVQNIVNWLNEVLLSKDIKNSLEVIRQELPSESSIKSIEIEPELAELFWELEQANLAGDLATLHNLYDLD